MNAVYTQTGLISPAVVHCFLSAHSCAVPFRKGLCMQPSQCICPVLHVILHAAGFVSKALLAAALTPGSCPLGRGQLSDLVFLLQSHDTKTKKTAIQDIVH